MSVRATRVSGLLVALAGCVLVAFFLADAVTSGSPSYWVLQSYPVTISSALICVGVLLARGHLVDPRYVRRLLGWTAVSVVVFVLFLSWFYGLAVVFRGRAPFDPPVGVVTLPALGALVGLLIGTYDARALESKQAVGRLSRVNETLRVATGELVEQADRETLERAVCERLVDSDAFTAAWVGRSDPEDDRLRPVAWVGFDDGVESLAVPVDGESETVWRRVLDTGAGAVVGNVRADAAVGRWRDALARHGVASMVVVPIDGPDGVSSLLCVCADQPNAFDDHLRNVFVDLGETVGHAVASIRARDALEVRERELEKQNSRLDDFVGVVSHDLRNPLNLIMGHVALFRQTNDRDHLDAIEQSGRRMEELITDLLALSRAGRPAADVERVSLPAVAEESWLTVETDGTTFDLRVPETTTIVADPTRLRTVFENLFRNAREHNDGPLTVLVGVVEAAADDASLAGFFVEDDGTGVPADERDDVFDHDYTTNTDGTGFGLAIVREVADAHDWAISVREGRDGGARFEITGVDGRA